MWTLCQRLSKRCLDFQETLGPQKNEETLLFQKCMVFFDFEAHERINIGLHMEATIKIDSGAVKRTYFSGL